MPTALAAQRNVVEGPATFPQLCAWAERGLFGAGALRGSRGSVRKRKRVENGGVFVGNGGSLNKIDLKYNSPLVNSVPWYNDRVYRGWTPNHAVLHPFRGLHLICAIPASQMNGDQ